MLLLTPFQTRLLSLGCCNFRVLLAIVVVDGFSEFSYNFFGGGRRDFSFNVFDRFCRYRAGIGPGKTACVANAVSVPSKRNSYWIFHSESTAWHRSVAA